MNSQSEAYECARNTATIQIDNTEWINEFSEGIKLNKGDQVRLLGSFVHEGSSGEEIEIQNDTELNIQYSPYLSLKTLASTDGNLVDLASYSDLPYSTDAFGIEPCYWETTDDTAATAVPNYNFPLNDQNPIATASQPGYDFGTGLTRFISPTDGTQSGDKAIVWGTNVNTSSALKKTLEGDANYTAFQNNSIPQELYIAQTWKKLILPFFDGTTYQPLLAPINNQFEEMVWDPPSEGPGMLGGIPKVGMCIATCDIGGGAGYFDNEGNGYFESDWGVQNQNIGIPNLKTGVQSVIGTIKAVRPIYHNMEGRRVGCFEIYVGDWVNPASISNRKIRKNFAVGELRDAKTMALTTTTITAYKQIHGSGEKSTNYNYNPSFNNINGGEYRLSQTNGECNNYIGTPTYLSYAQTANSADYETSVRNGGDSADPSLFQLGYGQPQGLSLLWNGSHNGGLRHLPQQVATADPATTLAKRGNYNQQWRTTDINGGPLPFPIANQGLAGMWCCISGFDTNPTPMPAIQYASTTFGAVPMNMGAYIICKKETMEAIAKGTYDSVDDPNFYSGTPGLTPRIWIEYSYQQDVSRNKTRHYTGNTWENIAGGAALVNPIVEHRYGYAFCGMPLSMNWRSSIPSPQTIRTFTAGTPVGFFDSNPNDPNNDGDGNQRYYSSITGYREWATGGGSFRGVPYVNGSYNNTINSVHFQQKETGDSFLGGASIIADGFTFNITAPGTTIDIAKATLLTRSDGAAFTPVIGDHIRVLYSLGVYPFTSTLYNDTAPIQTVVDNGTHFTLTLLQGTPGSLIVPFVMPTPTYTIGVATPADTRVIISRGGSYLGVGFGLDAITWGSDVLVIKEQLTKIKVEAGFYTEEQVAEKINNQLHLNRTNYQAQLGAKQNDGTYDIPSTLNHSNTALQSQPTIYNGNFIHTYIPDISYGFTPITADVATDTDLVASTKDLTDKIKTYTSFGQGEGGFPNDWQFYYSETIETDRPYTGTDVVMINEIWSNGKHFKAYSIPYIQEEGVFNPQIQLVRLRGGALNSIDYVANVWENKISRWCGSYESLRDHKGNAASGAVDFGMGNIFAYRCRLNRNLLCWGGGSRTFVGANNLTFSWEDGANRFSLNNLYTPLRPHAPINPDAQQTDFGIDDAMPSAIINAKYTGDTIGQLTGIYINLLNGTAFNFANWGAAPCGTDYLYDTDTDSDIQALGQNLLNALGFSAQQLANYNNDFITQNFTGIVNDLFVFKNSVDFYGTAIRVGPKLTTALNGSNPVASNCLNIAPVSQFFVEVSTNDFYAINVPQLGNDPYYFIGSDFPSKFFFGNLEGQKLPIIGICARNFHSFNFAFDLGGSAITFTITENITIKSIRTKIYTSTLGTPKNLSPFSSVIYLLSRANYAPDLNQQEIQTAV